MNNNLFMRGAQLSTLTIPLYIVFLPSLYLLFICCVFGRAYLIISKRRYWKRGKSPEIASFSRNWIRRSVAKYLFFFISLSSSQNTVFKIECLWIRLSKVAFTLFIFSNLASMHLKMHILLRFYKFGWTKLWLMFLRIF